MLQIITSNQVPDETYFRNADAEPTLSENTLTIYHGTGSRRSTWGQPGITSTLVLHTDNLVAVHIGYFHKHGGSQFWRYYRPSYGEWKQFTWQQLDDEDRTRILIAHEDRSPSFAKVPGKLRKNYLKPTLQTRTSYKLVQMVDGKFLSVFDNETEYITGKRLTERAVEEHGGGYYSYPSLDGVKQRFAEGSLFPSRCYQETMSLALIECEISGTILEYENGKLASTYLKPVQVIEQFDYTPDFQQVS